MTQVAGHLDFYGCLGAKGGAIYIHKGHMILHGGSQDRTKHVSERVGFFGGDVFLGPRNHFGNFLPGEIPYI